MGNFRKDNMKEFISTPEKLGEFMIELSKKYFNDVEEILEPCGGNGRLVDVIKKYYDVPILKYDIEPLREDIIEMNFIKEYKNIPEKKGKRLVIMNPPFSKTIPFIEKSLEISDYLVSLGGVNTLINLDYDKYEVLDLYYIKNQEYNEDVKVSSALFVLKNK